MLAEIFAWWARQMLGLLPHRAEPGDTLPSDALIVRIDQANGAPSRLTLTRRDRRVDRLLGSGAADAEAIGAILDTAPRARLWRQVVLDIPPASLLEREATLPLPAEAEMDRVLGYEMDRITPFSAEELFWSWRLLRRDRARALLHVRLSVVRKAALDDVLAVLRQAGIVPAMLSVAAPDGVRRLIPLVRPTGVRGGPARLRLAVGVCAVLAASVVVAPAAQNWAAISSANRRIDALKPQVAQVDALRRRIAAAASGTDAFAAEAARVGSPLQAIAALTEVLPDDTWLTALTLRRRQMTFSGQSARAARLIAALSSDPTLRNPTFLTPVTRADSAGGDLFSIRAELGL